MPGRHTHPVPQLLLAQLQGLGDDLVHVVILVGPEPSAEDHPLFLLRQLTVLLIERSVLLVIDRVVRLHPALPFRRELLRNHRPRNVPARSILPELEPLVFNDPRPRNLMPRIVHNSVALVIVRLQHLGLKPHGAVLQLAQRVIKILVDGSGKDQLVIAVRMRLRVLLP